MAATGPTYDVVLLAEQALSEVDAQEVIALHEELETDQQVRYHVLIPVEDAAARVEATLGSLGAGEPMVVPAMAMNDLDLEAVREECLQQSADALATSLRLLRAGGVEAEGRTVEEPPVAALAKTIAETDGREAIILTRPHLVAEFFHLDWTSKARRKLEVPVLHLLEHESIVEQSAGSGEGVSGV
ncbi:hypothetical protein [Nocardioides jiangxiensis]|uniref:Universal stress protein n=1 Tax=Nocardioides jiangxiensis TaxID=3064524 RepID=A0ABT9B1P4_9ACTN|nr:hypothetical protein [Nocardioides sp. WY-20]MDO7868774.1 hypothetical protein [Nocardioides sp. WY-20]